MFLNNFSVKIILIIFIVSFKVNFLQGIDKPLIKTGINSYGLFGLDDADKLYPTTLKDNPFTVFQEKFSDFFSFRHRTDLFISNYNTYRKNLEDLNSMLLYNSLYLYFYPDKKNEILILSKPMYYYYNGEKYLKLMDKLQYKVSLKNFTFKASYSHQYAFKSNELFYHNCQAGFYWKFPKMEFLKFKTLINVYFQHYAENNGKKASPVKSAVLNFEIAVDFNKAGFEELFDKNEENEFYEINNNLDFLILSGYN